MEEHDTERKRLERECNMTYEQAHYTEQYNRGKARELVTLKIAGNNEILKLLVRPLQGKFKCPRCGGSGREWDSQVGVFVEQPFTCRVCDGRDWMWQDDLVKTERRIRTIIEQEVRTQLEATNA